jgi:hypothetical protein
MGGGMRDTRHRPDDAARALESLRKQSYQGSEMIFSDNELRREAQPICQPLWMMAHREFSGGHEV